MLWQPLSSAPLWDLKMRKGQVLALLCTWWVGQQKPAAGQRAGCTETKCQFESKLDVPLFLFLNSWHDRFSHKPFRLTRMDLSAEQGCCRPSLQNRQGELCNSPRTAQPERPQRQPWMPCSSLSKVIRKNREHQNEILPSAQQARLTISI